MADFKFRKYFLGGEKKVELYFVQNLVFFHLSGVKMKNCTFYDRNPMIYNK